MGFITSNGIKNIFTFKFLSEKLTFVLTGSKGPFKCYVMQWGVGAGQLSRKKSVTKVYGSMLLTLRGGGWGSNFLEKALRNTRMAPTSYMMHCNFEVVSLKLNI